MKKMLSISVNNKSRSLPTWMGYGGIALGWAGCLGIAMPAFSQPLPDSPLQPGTIVFNTPKPPNQGSPSGRQRGGAGRGPCRQFEALTAMVPTTEGVVWGQTTRDRPSFWFYLPNALTASTPMEFTLQDAADNYVYKTRITAAGTQAGLIQVAMPATAKPLAEGQPYFWTFSVYCDPGKPSESIFVKGMIQRVATPLEGSTQSASSLEQAQLYAAKGIWFDAFHTLATLHFDRTKQTDVTAAWDSLLQQAGLASLAKTPFGKCCSPEQGTSENSHPF